MLQIEKFKIVYFRAFKSNQSDKPALLSREKYEIYYDKKVEYCYCKIPYLIS